MAKIKVSQYFESISGKLGKKSDNGVMLHHNTGNMYTVNYGEFKNPNTTKQQAKRTLFSTKGKAAGTWWQANKPLINAQTGAVTREGTADYKKVMAAYEGGARYKYNTPFLYVRSLINDDGTITLPGGTTSSTPTTDPTDPTNPDNLNPEL